MASERAAEMAHILRRLTFGPFPGGVERALDEHRTADDLLESLLEADPMPWDPPVSLDRPFRKEDEDILGNTVLLKHWVDRMSRDEAGLHEKVMWFWHTLWTTSAEKGNFLMLWKNLAKLHALAYADLGTIGKTLVIDPSMLQFLDGDGSNIQAPNENLARELMELFMLGRGNYTEEDVRAGARSLSGRHINFETGVAEFIPNAGPSQPDTFLGKTMVFNSDRVIDTILEHPAASTWTVRKLWRAFISPTPDEALVSRWGDAFRASGFQVKPLLRTMLTSDAFRESRLSKPRSGIEWFCAMKRATQLDDYEPWEMSELGQVPYFPPNVAGWPDSGWSSSSSLFARSSFVARHGVVAPDLDDDDLPTSALRWCGTYEVTPQTRRVLEDLDKSLRAPTGDRRRAMVRAVMLSPEQAVS